MPHILIIEGIVYRRVVILFILEDDIHVFVLFHKTEDGLDLHR